jgi:hypothetical protein
MRDCANMAGRERRKSEDRDTRDGAGGWRTAPAAEDPGPERNLSGELGPANGDTESPGDRAAIELRQPESLSGSR